MPVTCGTLATGASDVTVDMLVVCGLILDKRILFWETQMFRPKEPHKSWLWTLESVGGGSPKDTIELCHLHHNHHFPRGRVSLLSLLSSERVGRACSTTRGPSNAKHMKVARATQSNCSPRSDAFSCARFFLSLFVSSPTTTRSHFCTPRCITHTMLPR